MPSVEELISAATEVTEDPIAGAKPESPPAKQQSEETAAPASESPPATETKTAMEPAVHEIDESWVGIARAYGMTEDEARSFSSEKDLERALLYRARVAQEHGDQNGKPKERKPVFEPYKLEVAEDQIDPEIAKVVKGMNDYYAGQMNKMADALAFLANERQQQKLQQEAESKRSAKTWFNGKLKGLANTEYADILGNREEVDKLAKRIVHEARWAQEAGEDVDHDALFDQALKILYPGKKDKAQADAAIADRLRDKQTGQFLAKPSAAKPAPLSLSDEDEEKTRMIAEFIAKRNQRNASNGL